MKDMNFRYLFSFEILLLILPILILSGPFLSDVLVSLLAIYFLFNFKKVLNDKQLKLLFYFFISFYILINISAQLSTFVNINVNSIFYFRFFLFSFCFIVLIKNPNFFFRYLSIIILIIFLILLIDSFFEFFYNVNLLNYDNNNPNRISSLFKDELVLGSFTVRLLPVLLGSLVFSLSLNNKYKDFIILLILLIALSLIFLSGERTSLILFFIFFLYLFIFWNTKLILKLSLVFISFLIFLFFISENFKQRFLLEPLVQLNLVSVKTLKEKNIVDKTDFSYPELKTKKIYLFSVHHERHYIAAWKIFKDHIYLGAGPKSFRVACKDPKYRAHIFDEYEGHINVNEWSEKKLLGVYKYLDNENQSKIDTIFSNLGSWSMGLVKLHHADQACSTHPHNTHVQILSELGLVGYLYLVIFILLIIKLSLNIKDNKLKFKHSKFKDSSILFLGGCFMNLWPIAPSGNFFNNWLSIFYYLPVGLLLYCLSQRIKANENISK